MDLASTRVSNISGLAQTCERLEDCLGRLDALRACLDEAQRGERLWISRNLIRAVRGIPRLVQSLALGALLAAATANKKTVDIDAVQQALLDQEAA